MLTKGAIGNLVNRYRAVLRKCNLINTFGSLAVASMLVLGGAGVAGAADLPAAEDGKITLTENIEGNSTERFNVDTTIDLNGKNTTNIFYAVDEGTVKIENTGANTATISHDTWGALQVGWMGNTASLILSDGVKIYSSATSDKEHTITIAGTGDTGKLTSLIIDGATIESANKIAISGNGTHHNTAITINSGTIKGGGYGIYHPQIGTLTVNGGTISGGKTGIEMRSGMLNISGGEISGNGDPFEAFANGSGATVQGAAIAISQHSTDKDINVTISGGTFTGEHYALFEIDGVEGLKGLDAEGNETTDTNKIKKYEVRSAEDGPYNENTKISITGGTFNGKIYSQNVKNFISGGTFSDESALAYLASKADITVTDAEIASYENEDGDEHTITFGAEGGSKVESVALADNSSTTFDGKAAITKMTAGEKTTLTINSADISAKESDLQKTEVKVSGDVNDALGGAEGLAAQLGTTVDKIGTLNMEEGLISGAVVNGVQKTSTILKDTLEQATAAPLAVNRILMNDVRKRMGDLRDTKEDAGVWMRWDGGKLKGDEGLTNNFNTIQIGADMLTGIKNVRAGVAGSFTHGDVDHRNGDGEMEAYTFAAYGTWMADNGMFADVIARVGFNNTELNIKGGKADLDNEALSLSAEYGWRLPVCNQFFVEPQVELTYTYVTGADFTIKTANYDVDAVDSLLGRAGLAAGWKLPNERGNIYARASVVHEFLGDSKISATNNGGYNAFELDGSDTWLEYGIGANVKLTDNTYVWADVERTEGADIEEEWRGTVGVRFSF